MRQLTAAVLVTMIRSAISVVQQCGFIVVVIVADNNQINSKAAKDLLGGCDCVKGMQNPDFPEHEIGLYFMFDTVHI